jgi:hypothetical protein
MRAKVLVVDTGSKHSSKSDSGEREGEQHGPAAENPSGDNRDGDRGGEEEGARRGSRRSIITASTAARHPISQIVFTANFVGWLSALLLFLQSITPVSDLKTIPPGEGGEDSAYGGLYFNYAHDVKVWGAYQVR